MNTERMKRLKRCSISISYFNVFNIVKAATMAVDKRVIPSVTAIVDTGASVLFASLASAAFQLQDKPDRQGEQKNGYQD
jgi:hypothetical protein